jgi:hypothetical protein
MLCGHLCDGKECADAIFEQHECPMCYAELDELMDAEQALAKLRREGKRAYVC